MLDHLRFGWPGRQRAAGRTNAAIAVITLAIAGLTSGCGTAAPHTAPQTAVVQTAPQTAVARTAPQTAVARTAPHTAVARTAVGQPRLVQPRRTSAVQLARLPMATTFGTTPAAPRDLTPFA